MLSLGIAFLAGLLSFFSPCVFALVPAFLAYLAGVNLHALKEHTGFNRVIFLNTLFYVLGFTVVFTAIGLLLNTALVHISLSVREWIGRIGAVFIILFGLLLIGLFNVSWLQREHKLQVTRKASYFTSFLFGMSFAVGWTPCVGAVLGGIFTLAASQPGSSLALLLLYSLGLSVPFLLVGTFYSAAARFIRLSAKYTRAVSIVLGVLLVIVGVLLFFNKLGFFGGVPWFASYL
jgi:cytochrome c-type biogenesis protein